MKRETNSTVADTVIYLTDVRPLQDEELFSLYLARVSPDRRETVARMHYQKDKLLSLAGGILLDLLLKDRGLEDEILHAENGRPYAAHHPEIFVSLTHAYPYAAAMISSAPCGLDIENRSRDLSAVIRRWYSDREKSFLTDHPDSAVTLWCRKECLIKYHSAGTDISGSSSPDNGIRSDTFLLPENYEYLSLPLEGFAFEVLKPTGSHMFREIALQYIS